YGQEALFRVELPRRFFRIPSSNLTLWPRRTDRSYRHFSIAQRLARSTRRAVMYRRARLNRARSVFAALWPVDAPRAHAEDRPPTSHRGVGPSGPKADHWLTCEPSALPSRSLTSAPTGP